MFIAQDWYFLDAYIRYYHKFYQINYSVLILTIFYFLFFGKNINYLIHFLEISKNCFELNDIMIIDDFKMRAVKETENEN